MNYRRLSLTGLGLVAIAATMPHAVLAQRPHEVMLEPVVVQDAEIGGTAYVPSQLSVSNRAVEGPIRAIVNRDDRVPVLNRNYPWSSIGRVDWVDAEGAVVGACTGTLIGPRLVLTNAHCLIDESTDRPTTYKIVFRPNVIQGQAEASAQVVAYEYGDSPSSGNQTDDWALLTLDQPLGETFGYLGWRTLDFTDPEVLAAIAGQVSVVGYSGDFPTAASGGFGAPGETAGWSADCSVLLVIPEGDDLGGSLIHTCDTNPGASGAPLFALFEDGSYYILGLHTGSVSLLENITLPTGGQTDVLNRGVPVSRWSSRAAALW